MFKIMYRVLISINSIEATTIQHCSEQLNTSINNLDDHLFVLRKISFLNYVGENVLQNCVCRFQKEFQKSKRTKASLDTVVLREPAIAIVLVYVVLPRSF